MNSKTPRTDAALGGLLYSHPYLEKAVGEVALMEIELNEAKSQVAFLERLVHTSDEALAGLEETQTICEAQQEALESLSTLTIPIADVKPLRDVMQRAADVSEWAHPVPLANLIKQALVTFFSKHPNMKP